MFKLTILYSLRSKSIAKKFILLSLAAAHVAADTPDPGLTQKDYILENEIKAERLLSA